METITVLKIEPGKIPAVTQLEASIKAFNQAISIGADEIGKACSKKIASGIYILYNKDGFLYDLAANRKVGKDILAGVFYVIGAGSDYRPRSLTLDEIWKYINRFWVPEEYSYSDVLENLMDALLDSLTELEKL